MQYLQLLKNSFSKFTQLDLRPQQIEALQQLLDSTAKVVCLQAPTGSGKTLIGAMFLQHLLKAGACNGRVCYLTNSKMLQRQIVDDFPEFSYMAGRSNFDCIRYVDTKCDMCTHSINSRCPDIGLCSYYLRKKLVLLSKYHLLNYHYFLNSANYSGDFTDYVGIVADEADTLENILTDFTTVTITQALIDKYGLPEAPRKTFTANDAIERWQGWFKNAYKKIGDDIASLEAYVARFKPPLSESNKVAIKRLRRLENLARKIELLLEYLDDSWIYQDFETKWEFKPIWLYREISKRILWRHAKRFLLMSATLVPKPVFAKAYGVNEDEVEYYWLESVFNPKNRPVYFYPVADLSYKTIDSQLSQAVDATVVIINNHPNDKGMVHTVSYKILQELRKRNADTGYRMLFHDSSDKDSKLETFVSSEEPLVFVSPSSTRGLDLPDDLCRFSIMVKAPYLSLGDKVTKNRLYSGRLGRLWYKASCVNEIVQASGRGVRHRDDYCATYVLDRQALKLFRSSRKLFPQYFLEATEVVDELPLQ